MATPPEGTRATVAVDALLLEAREAVDRALERWLPPSAMVPERLHEAMRYSTLAAGKRVRPALCLETGRILGATREALLPAACALEMMHAFSLVHDDLPAMDDDDLRRGRPTNHVVFGEAIAILAGDALSVLAFEVLLRETQDPAVARDLALVLARDVGPGGMIGGQALDLLGEQLPPRLELVQEIHRRKTAALIRAACEMGAIVARAGGEARARAARFGELVGLAFQVQDDVLDETSTASALGKGTRKDQERGKQTYPACAGLAESRRLAAALTAEAIEVVRPLDRDGTLEALARFIIDRAS